MHVVMNSPKPKPEDFCITLTAYLIETLSRQGWDLQCPWVVFCVESDMKDQLALVRHTEIRTERRSMFGPDQKWR